MGCQNGYCLDRPGKNGSKMNDNKYGTLLTVPFYRQMFLFAKLDWAKLRFAREQMFREAMQKWRKMHHTWTTRELFSLFLYARLHRSRLLNFGTPKYERHK
jgi:hypothetical protein